MVLVHSDMESRGIVNLASRNRGLKLSGMPVAHNLPHIEKYPHVWRHSGSSSGQVDTMTSSGAIVGTHRATMIVKWRN
jgi:hypothetical protein